MSSCLTLSGSTKEREKDTEVRSRRTTCSRRVHWWGGTQAQQQQQQDKEEGGVSVRQQWRCRVGGGVCWFGAEASGTGPAGAHTNNAQQSIKLEQALL